MTGFVVQGHKYCSKNSNIVKSYYNYIKNLIYSYISSAVS